MQELSIYRLYLLRATYALILVGLGVEIWPLLVHPPTDLPLMKGVVRSVLTAVSLLAALGIRYPVKMLPLLFFEFVWKSIWVLVFGLPLWTGHLLDAESSETMKACLMGVILMPLVIPWPYVIEHYVKAPSDRWRADVSARLRPVE
jgi:hypothetical protein